MIHDISRSISLPLALRGVVHSFERAPDVGDLIGTAKQATAAHADSDPFCAHNASAALWRKFAAERKLGKIGADFDKAYLHADSGSSLPPLALRNQLGPDIFQPTQDFADLLDTINTRAVPGDDVGYFRNFVKLTDGGGVILVEGDQTKFNTVGYKPDQELRPLHAAGIAVSTGWMERRKTGAAGVPDMAWKMLALRQAFRQFFYNVRRNGIAGLDLYSLASLPGLLRWASPYVIGTATIAQLHSEIINVLTKAQILSPAGMAPDTVILTDRIMAGLMATTGFPTNSTDAWEDFTKQLGRLGINRLVTGKSLRDIGGTNIDGMLVARTGGTDGMAQVQGLDSAPVWTYQDSSGDNTLYISTFGDLEQPVAEGSLLAEFEVIP